MAKAGQSKKPNELKQRIIFVVLALLVYRLGTFVPLPNVDTVALQKSFSQQEGLLAMFNMFSGGALGRMTIFALNIMPYITVSIVIQLLTMVSPALGALKKEGAAGRAKINQYTRYGTVVMCIFQALTISLSLERADYYVSKDFILFYRLTTIVTLTGGTLFLMWLGEQITQRGIGNGISLIIFAGIVAELPRALATMFDSSRSGQIDATIVLTIVAVAVGLIFFIVFMERSQRRINVQYPKRQIGNKEYAGQNSHLPLKINSAGVIPPIFASAILFFPSTVNFVTGGADPEGILANIGIYLGRGKPLFLIVYVALITFFCFFYTKHQYNPTETADNLRKNGGFVPGIRPGKHTAKYIDYVLTRITVIGAAYICIVCLVPEIMIMSGMQFIATSAGMLLGGTSLLIVVNVTMDTVAQIQSHLMAQQYESVINKQRGDKKGPRRKRY